ncbi:MAG TPA: GTPase HflX, partial [Spirochaetota bacterium]|nr:GTPase HflX [Spirochaetota bacterium]
MDASVNRISPAADQRALLVAVQQSADDPEEVRDSLDELTLLVATAGAIVVETMVVKRASFDPAYLIGVGVLDRIKSINADCSIRLVVVDLNTIKPAQVRNLEEYLGCRVVGRTEIILDIFARRARSAESKIQVELAQLRYILPRLKGLGGVLSRLG